MQIWQEFFILAANIGSRQNQNPNQQQQDQEGEYGDDDGELYNDEGDSASRTAAAQHPAAPDESSANFFESIRHAQASSPQKGRRGDGKEDDGNGELYDDAGTSWAAMESPFERLKKEIAQHAPSGEQSMSQAEIALARAARARADAKRKQREEDGVRGDTNDRDVDAAVDETADDFAAKARLALDDDDVADGTPPPPRSPAKLRATPRLLHRVLQSEQSKANTRQGSAKWDGVADLTKTPLRGGGGGGSRKGRSVAPAPQSSSSHAPLDAADTSSDSSLAWPPPGMSPPVTMQFSVPRSRFAKTPAKEAAKMLMDDLLRTAEAGPETARREMERRRRHQQQAAGERLQAGPTAGSSTTQATPLKKGPLGRVRGGRRDSMPTPPTITRVVGADKRKPAPLDDTLDDSLPDFSRNTPMSAASGQGGRAAMLLDEGEDGGGDDGADDLADLTAGPLATAAVVDARRPTDLDSLLSQQHTHRATSDDEESESDSEDSDDDDDDSDDSVGVAGHTQGPRPRAAAPSARSMANLDNDTLFGIGASSSSRTSANTTRDGVSPLQPTQPPRPAASSSSTARDAFQLRGGQLEDTVRGGKLLEERDLTYSAPSPTPAPTQAGVRARGSGGGGGGGGV